MGRRIVESDAQLRAYIQDEWDKITIKEINKLIITMPQRVQDCIDRKGDITQW